jgi:hypothetical protein
MVLEKLKVNKHKPYKIQIKQLPWLVIIKEPRGSLDSTLFSPFGIGTPKRRRKK